MTEHEVLLRMDRQITDWQSTGDRRHIFLSCYRLMTGNMLKAIEDGQFYDAEWVNRLLHRFSDYYFDGVSAFESGQNTPAVWKQVHEATRDRDLFRIQYMLLGINAHINYDLVLSIHDLLQPEWDNLPDRDRNKRHEDHRKVNHIIADTIDTVQDEILEPGDRLMAIIDTAFGRMDELLLSHLIKRWRHHVWEHSQEMLATSDENEREKLRLDLEEKVLHWGDMLSW